MVLGQALGCDLSEDEHHHRRPGGRGGRSQLRPQKADHQHGGDGGHGDVDDVVADEDGGKKRVVALGKTAGQLGPPVPLVRQAPQAGAAGGGKGRLGGGKIGRHGQQPRQGQGRGKDLLNTHCDNNSFDDIMLFILHGFSRERPRLQAQKNTPSPPKGDAVCRQRMDSAVVSIRIAGTVAVHAGIHLLGSNWHS